MPPEYVSLLDSYLFWNDPLRRSRVLEVAEFWPSSRDEWLRHCDGDCVFCHGFNILDGRSAGLPSVYCLCEFLEQVKQLGEVGFEWESPWQREQVNKLDPSLVVPKEGGQDLRDALKFIGQWENNPREWVYLWSNSPGTGKTTILYQLKRKFGPLAFYITAPDFQQDLFSRLGDNDAIAELLSYVKGVPILLLDDLGSEYDKSDWTYKMIFNVVNARYTFSSLFPVVVTSNVNPDHLVTSPDKSIQRLASRLIDGNSATILRLRGVDYRVAVQVQNMRG